MSPGSVLVQYFNQLKTLDTRVYSSDQTFIFKPPYTHPRKTASTPDQHQLHHSVWDNKLCPILENPG